MKTLLPASLGNPATFPFLEPLEDRRLLSVALPTALTVSSAVSPTPSPSVTATSAILQGRTIHAESNQPFKVVIGTISRVPAVPTGYALHGLINWGDGTPSSAATFQRQPDGSVAVLGSHTYAAVGSDAITITVTENPPPGSLAAIRLVGQIHSTAKVISSSGGVTLEETAGVPFTAAVGSFSSTLSSLSMTATINWGDGTSSVGKILALPVANPGASPIAGGRFQVVGSHTYAHSRSYLVHVVVTARPTPLPGQPTPTFIILVADIDSVIDVLPASPIA